MRAVWITKAGPPSVLEVRETPDPEPGPGQVRVRVKAAGLSFADTMARQGLYPDAPPLPTVVGYEVSGVVDAVGPGAKLARGAEVVGLTHFGGHSDTVVVPEQQLRPKPASLSFEQAAAVPVNYLTAHHALFHIGPLHPGSRVLIHSAAGGVGTAAIQLCRTVPGVEIFGTASARKHAMLREAGVQHPIDYRTVDYEEEVRRLTGGRGVHVILDALGGHDWAKGYRLLAPTGRLVAFGLANASARGKTKRNLLRAAMQLVRVPRFNPMSLMDHNRTVSGLNIGHLWEHTDMLVPQFERVLRLCDEGHLRPVLDRTFRFAEAGAAHERLQSGESVGKVVLIP